MTADTFKTLARCKALALAAMIDAGGKPCWVASDPPLSQKRQVSEHQSTARNASDAMLRLPLRQLASVTVKSSRYAASPRRSPLAAAAAAAAPAPVADQPGTGLTPAELARLAGSSPRLLAAMSRALSRLPLDGINATSAEGSARRTPAKRSRAGVAGGSGWGGAQR